MIFLLWLLVSLVVFFGLGIITGWLERKLTARLQWRVGPPWWQNLADFVKLLGKEVVVPETATSFFSLAPVIGLAAVTTAGAMILLAAFQPGSSVDLIVLIYILVLPSLSLILAGASSGNPLASVGVARELKLMLGYELPFILALLVPVVKAGTTNLGVLFRLQLAQGMTVGSISGLLAFGVALLTIQGKIGGVPFDVSEAETEIASGLLIEYSGLLLGIFKLTRWMLTAVAVFFLVFYFWAGLSRVPSAIGKYLLIVILLVLIKNTNPRLRIDQAMKFFWGWLTGISVTAILFAYLGW
ncbi:MAG: NADH-quinone oxidoreductase subunit H [Candidatus Omnitrophica bacterium]|nr:NADH-quinone oxidoreductase subunit H [Candidatus Omnitrophota bacterium]